MSKKHKTAYDFSERVCCSIKLQHLLSCQWRLGHKSWRIPSPGHQRRRRQKQKQLHGKDVRKMNMVLQITKRINTPSVLNTDLPNIKLRVTHLSLRYKSKNKPLCVCMCMCILTSWSRELSCFQLVNKFPAFYGTQRFITVVTSGRHLSLS